MKDYSKKAGIILCHIICIVVLVCSFLTGQVKEDEKEVQTVKLPEAEQNMPNSATTPEPTSEPTPTVAPTPTEVPSPTATPEPTSEPTSTVAPTPTEVPSPTATPEPTSEPTPTVTLTPTEVPSPTVTPKPTTTPLPTVNPEEERAEIRNQVLQNIENGVYSEMDNTGDGWWFYRKTKQVPSGSGEFFPIADYQGYYRNKSVTDEDKVIYLTLDCGFASTNTSKILDIFKKYDVKVTYFVTGTFLNDSPEEVKRMVSEGHTVANHTISHKDLVKLTDSQIYEQITGCEDSFYKLTGTQNAMFFRPPEGAYSRRTMQLTKDLGYKTIFWSIAYNDYDKNNQPGKEYVLDHFEKYHHNGAIALMHNDSKSNMEAMEDLIIFLKEQGYRFGTLDELGQ